jgi:hypothetical protein
METLVAHGSPPLEENNGRHDVMIPAKLDPRYGEYLLLGSIPSYPGFENGAADV